MKIRCNAYWASAWQLAIVLVLLWLTRFAFYYYNADVIGQVSFGRLMMLSLHGLRFDLTILAYANLPFVMMRFLPFDFTRRRGWRLAEMIVYGICNSALLIINIGDIAYFRFNGGRLRMDGFLSLFSPEMVSTTMSYAEQYWWAFLAVGCAIGLLIFLSTRFEVTQIARRQWVRVLLLVVAALVEVMALRGTFESRPLSMFHAARVTDEPREINIVLNSPFSILRSKGYSTGFETMTFSSDSDSEAVFSALKNPSASLAADSLKEAVRGKNIVVIVIESGSQLWLDSLNVAPGDSARGLMPFLSDIADKSFAITDHFCTGTKTSAGIASLIGATPTFDRFEWMNTRYASLSVDAPARLLRKMGYSTCFYFAEFFRAFNIGPHAKAMGFERTMTFHDMDLPADSANEWGYYDDIAAQYFARDISTLQQPFFALWLTLDLHAPFDIPEGWDAHGYPHREAPIERCVQYTDYSLRRFFDMARSQPWFENTLFVITADHGCRDLKTPLYNSPWVFAHIPMLLYTPDGSMPAGRHHERPMAQFDFAATLLWLAGYDRPYVNVGTNWFDDSKPHYGLFFRNDTWYLFSSTLALAVDTDGRRIVAAYDVVADPAMSSPLVEPYPTEADTMLRWLRAYLQEYTSRANNANLAL